ncbi:MAG TPA: hypothetical protein VEV15_05715 [Flavisolibacter sp.]|nr:hypothetical protein [Flavisolibacter sp.]
MLVSLIGLLMRSFPFLASFPLEYKNILHGHSHFAFGGWIMPVLLALFLRSFPEIAEKVHYRHWRNIAVLMLASAYGMLLSFPVQGYKAVSIFFSTASIAAGYYMVFVILKAIKAVELKTAHRFVKWGLIYFSISAIGPFATGPLIAMGKQGTPLYFDAIYFYLHFQYNGFFTFFILAFLYCLLQQKGRVQHGKKVFVLFNLACVPTYALSILLNQPPVLFNVIGGAGALLQVAGFLYLVKDIKSVSWERSWISYLLLFSFIAFAVKIVLQLFSALPSLALVAYQYRNFVIAYLHLVLLGFISTFFFAQVFAFLKDVKAMKRGLSFFMFSFLTTELLLVANAFSLAIPYYTQLLLVFSFFFPVGLLWINAGIKQNLQNSIQLQ